MKIASLLYALVLLLLAVGGLVRIQSQPSAIPRPIWVDHTLFNTGSKVISVPGISSRNADDWIFRNTWAAHTLRALGYAIRTSAGQVPGWLLLSDSVWKKDKVQILIREELVDEYDSPPLRATYDRNLKRYAVEAHKLENRFAVRMAFLFVPTKIFANRIHMPLHDALLSHRRMFEINSDTRLVGSDVNQRAVEAEIVSEGVPNISLLDTYKRLQGGDPTSQLYSNGDSHWSRRTVLAIGRSIAEQVVSAMKLPASCLNAEQSIQDLMRGVPTEEHMGDLFNYIQVDPAFSPLARKFSFTDIGDFSALPAYKSGLATKSAGCPDVIFAGSSYGASHVGEGDVAQSIGLHYRGNVINRSVAGKGPFGPIRELKDIRPGSIVIWEFPFRSMKDGGAFASP